MTLNSNAEVLGLWASVSLGCCKFYYLPLTMERGTIALVMNNVTCTVPSAHPGGGRHVGV